MIASQQQGEQGDEGISSAEETISIIISVLSPRPAPKWSSSSVLTMSTDDDDDDDDDDNDGGCGGRRRMATISKKGSMTEA